MSWLCTKTSPPEAVLGFGKFLFFFYPPNRYISFFCGRCSVTRSQFSSCFFPRFFGSTGVWSSEFVTLGAVFLFLSTGTSQPFFGPLEGVCVSPFFRGSIPYGTPPPLFSRRYDWMVKYGVHDPQPPKGPPRLFFNSRFSRSRLARFPL